MQETGSDIIILFASNVLLIVIIIILAFFFLYSYQKKVVKQKLQLQEVKMDLQQKLLTAAVNAQEKERKRIASDLHDDIGSLLSALKLNLKHFKTLDCMGDVEQENLDSALEMLNDGLSNVRSISYNLLPPTLVRFGLVEALNELVKRIDNQDVTSVQTDFGALEHVNYDEKTELSVFRVIQELLTNTVHHANATEISIQCRFRDGLEIVYKDNGVGIKDKAQLLGLGMINLQSRMQTIKGSIEFSEINTPGFQARVKIPGQTPGV